MYIAVQINNRTEGQLATDINEYQTWVGPVHASTRYSDLEFFLKDRIGKHTEERWLILSASQIAEATRSPVEIHAVRPK